MKFSYKKIAPGVLRPIIPIEISYHSLSIRYEVLVDSGADTCIFDAQIGEILRIPVNEGEKHFVTGVTGVPEPYYVHDVRLKIAGYEIEATVGFLPRATEWSNGIVGQKGFFEHFKISFDLSKEQIELKPHSK